MADKLDKDPDTSGHKRINIIVNGTTTPVDTDDLTAGDELTYDQVIELAFPDGGRGPQIEYTVTYYNGPRDAQGGLSEGELVKIKSGTVFNVTRTDRS